MRAREGGAVATPRRGANGKSAERGAREGGERRGEQIARLSRGESAAAAPDARATSRAARPAAARNLRQRAPMRPGVRPTAAGMARCAVGGGRRGAEIILARLGSQGTEALCEVDREVGEGEELC